MISSSKKIRILIVDDSKVMAQLLKTLIDAESDFEVIGIAEDGSQGVSMAKALKPDLITMDILMPVMDGFEATQAIMAAQPTPIVIISGNIIYIKWVIFYQVMILLVITLNPENFALVYVLVVEYIMG